MVDDVDDFINTTDKAFDEAMRKGLGIPTLPSRSSKKEEVKVGAVSQYSQYGAGYKPTTHTVPILMSGCYVIKADQYGIYVEPTPPPTGLLLELPEMRSEEVIKMVERFWDSEKDYKEGNEFVKGGAAFKAGIMLYGPPGSGKSSTIKIVSKKIVERDGIVFFADYDPGTIQSFLINFSTIEKDRKCVVILEDIDSLIYNFGESGYLNMLDSAQSIDNVLFIATTNYPDKLDPRIYNRPGRFSHVIKIGNPGVKAREAFLKAILKNHRDVDYIVQKSEGFSIDHLSALVNSVYREKKDLKSELDRLRRLFKIPKVGEDNVIGIQTKEDCYE